MGVKEIYDKLKMNERYINKRKKKAVEKENLKKNA